MKTKAVVCFKGTKEYFTETEMLVLNVGDCIYIEKGYFKITDKILFIDEGTIRYYVERVVFDF